MFLVNSNESTPLYKQLYNQIREDILSGRLVSDSKLPSIRDLANELAISRNTVDGAYQELYAEGYIYSKPRSGYYISELDQESAPRSLTRHLLKQQSVTDSTSYSYDFHPARLDVASFPATLWKKCFVEVMHLWSHETSGYSDPQGIWRLRLSLQSYLERSRGVLCEPEQIIISAGLQQSLDVVAHLLQDKHSKVAVEEPSVNAFKDRFGFLGFAIWMGKSRRTGNSYPHVQPSKKSLRIIKDRVTELTKRQRTLKPLVEVVREVNVTVR